MKKFVRLALFLALAIVLNIVESFIPFFNGIVPGLKIGLANVIVLFVLYFYSIKEAAFVSILRVLVVGLLRTGLFSVTFIFSLAGAISALIFMYLAKRFCKFTIVGVSVVGSVMHSIAQLVAAALIFRTANLTFYIPIILLIAVPTGVLVGLLADKVLDMMNKKDGIEATPKEVVAEEKDDDEFHFEVEKNVPLSEAVEAANRKYSELSKEKEQATEELFEEVPETVEEPIIETEELVEEETPVEEVQETVEDVVSDETIVEEKEKKKSAGTKKKQTGTKKKSTKKK